MAMAKPAAPRETRAYQRLICNAIRTMLKAHSTRTLPTEKSTVEVARLTARTAAITQTSCRTCAAGPNPLPYARMIQGAAMASTPAIAPEAPAIRPMLARHSLRNRTRSLVQYRLDINETAGLAKVFCRNSMAAVHWMAARYSPIWALPSG